MIEGFARIIVMVILALLESWGTGPVTAPPAGSPSAPSEGSGATAVARRSDPAMAVVALLRAVDPCGLHSIAAAVQVTGDRADQIIPVESLSACQLRLHRQPGEPTWTFTTRVGVAYAAGQRNGAAQEEIDGRWVYREEHSDPHDRSCTYTRAFGAAFGISLTASAPVSEPAARPCPVAKAYLVAAQSLSRLVLRAERRTEPPLALAGADPCAATSAILRALATSGTAQPREPAVCRIQPDPTPGEAGPPAAVTIGFRFGPDPAELLGAGTAHRPVAVGGHPGTAVTDPNTGRCDLTVAYQPEVAVHTDHTRLIQQITINAGSCRDAESVAGIVIADLESR